MQPEAKTPDMKSPAQNSLSLSVSLTLRAHLSTYVLASRLALRADRFHFSMTSRGLSELPGSTNSVGSGRSPVSDQATADAI